MNEKLFILTGLMAFGLINLEAEVTYGTIKNPNAPSLPREFRGAWIATVNNIDWPSKPGLPITKQKKELAELINAAARLKLNCLIFQVRPACDALYPSKLEPWSEYLTGKMGKAPSPAWDPLAYAINESHRRGLELHAWFNPYRARYKGAKGTPDPNHISRTQPTLVKTYDGYQWLDPAEPAAANHSLSVIMDVVNRYDVDGIHIDDYFYPYPDSERTSFPDEISWKKSNSKLSRKDWRRMHINSFIKRIHNEIHKVKPYVKFGISPFGIWRPGYPEQIKGLDAYDELYADARLWLRKGWMDYCAPQLYWRIDDRDQSYPILMQWWHEQNPKGRHLWPGNNSAKVNPWPASEITKQIELTRKHQGATGNIHWNLSTLAKNRGNLGTQLITRTYTQPALVPASKWLDSSAPKAPAVFAKWDKTRDMIRINWRTTDNEPIRWWLFQVKTDNRWISKLMPGNQRMALLRPGKIFPEIISLTALDMAGNASITTALTKK